MHATGADFFDKTWPATRRASLSVGPPALAEADMRHAPVDCVLSATTAPPWRFNCVPGLRFPSSPAKCLGMPVSDGDGRWVSVGGATVGGRVGGRS